MPILSSLGGMSARGFGRIKSSRAPVTLIDTFTLPNADTKYVVGDIINFTKPADTAAITASNGIYTFPVRNGINFRIKLYGAAGGYHNGLVSQYGSNSNGATLDVLVNLTVYQNTNLYIVRGGGGQNASSGVDGSTGRVYGDAGYNGGGYGSGNGGGGGGGRTDLRTGNPSGTAATNYNTELLVAAGGGGGWGGLGQNGTRYYGSNGCSGTCGSYPCDNAGGGGGYYGGAASCGDDDRNSGTGTNYYDSGKTITVYTNTTFNTNSGGNTGHGYFSIEVISVS